MALSGEHSQNERNQALQALRDRRARICVATDVASRGIDLPNLSLVIHVELPRDAEILQHRSGRTGRAGKKGTAVLVVPYPARRRVDAMLRGARINAEWLPVPTPEDIRRNDHERLLAALLEAPVEVEEEDRALAARLLAERSPEDIAAALVRMHRSKMPGVEELLDASGPPPRPERHDGPRPGFEDTQWFRMDVGRQQNADPRWLLPLICRRGHVTKAEIGAIRILPQETMFEIAAAAAPRFREALRRTEGEDRSPEGGIRIIPANGPPPPQGRGPRGPGGPGGKPNRPVLVRPLGPQDDRGPPRRPRGPGPNRPPPARGKLRTP